MAYATVEQLRARLSAPYADHGDVADDDAALALLEKASELIDEETLGRAARVDADNTAGLEALAPRSPRGHPPP